MSIIVFFFFFKYLKTVYLKAPDYLLRITRLMEATRNERKYIMKIFAKYIKIEKFFKNNICTW